MNNKCQVFYFSGKYSLLGKYLTHVLFNVYKANICLINFFLIFLSFQTKQIFVLFYKVNIFIALNRIY